MNKSLLLVPLLALAGLVWSRASAQAPAANVAHAKFEYKVVTGEPSEPALNKLGDEGWELAATTANVSGGSMRSGTGGGINTQVRLVFKRAKR